MDKNKEKLNQGLMLVVGILIGLAIGFIIFPNQADDASVALDDENTETGLELNDDTDIEFVDDDNEVAVSDQGPGEVVIVEDLEVAEPTWVAIYTDVNGEAGSVLGARFFDAGEYEDVEVELLNVSTTPGNTYHAMLHVDDGKIVETVYGRHEFDSEADELLEVSDTFQVIPIGARGI